MRITDIVDNRAADGFAAEHGLSLLIEHGDERNYVLEEQALLTEDGVLVTGCCHAGIMNTVQAFRRAVPHIAIRTIVGGLHLCHATDEEIAQTGDFLKQLNLDRIILLHCTGEAAGAKLKEVLSCPVVWGAAGTSAWTNPNSKREGCCNSFV